MTAQGLADILQHLAVFVLLFFLILVIRIGHAATCLPPQSYCLSKVDTLLSHEALPPAADDERWQPQTLPTAWRTLTVWSSTPTWYRAVFHLEPSVTDLWSIYVPNIPVGTRTFINGDLVYQSGTLSMADVPKWQRPLFITLPKHQLKSGENVIHIHVHPSFVLPGYVSQWVIGDYKTVRAQYDQRYMRQVALPQALTIVVLVLGLYALLLWFFHRHRSEYGWLALCVLSWAAFSSCMYFSSPTGMDGAWVTRLEPTLLAWFVTGLILFCRRYTGRSKAWFDRVLIGMSTLASLVYALVPLQYVEPIGSYAMSPFLIIMALGSAVELGLGFLRTRCHIDLILFFTIMLVLLFGGNDLKVFLAQADAEDYLLLHYIVPVLLLSLGAIIVVRFTQASQTLAQLNEQLDLRVAAQSDTLHQYYQHVHALEKETLLAQERQRLVMDMHDGIGGQLMSLLALAHRNHVPQAELVESLQSAMDDLRIIMDSLDFEVTDLRVALAALCARLSPRAQSCGVQLAYDAQKCAEPILVGPQATTHLCRIVQEAISNVFKHARATAVRIQLRSSSTSQSVVTAELSIHDNGCGIKETGATTGRGLRNIQKRAKNIGGEFTVTTDDQAGTTLLIRFPLPAPTMSTPLALRLEQPPSLKYEGGGHS